MLGASGLKNGTLVWTPTGFTSIQHLKVGDKVIGGDGAACAVTSVARKRPRTILRLNFDRGVQIECGADQEWRVLPPVARYSTRHSQGKWEPNPRFGQWAVVRAAEMLMRSGPAPRPRRRYLIPAAQTVQMAKKTVPLHPYLFGVLLGDGCFRNGVSVSTGDDEILQSVLGYLPPGLIVCKRGKYDHHLVLPGGRGHGRGGGASGNNPIRKLLADYGLFGLLSADKFVPDDYLFNCAAVRLALLQGLMDTDGYVTPTQGAMEFSSTSPKLTEALEILVASFGGKSFTELRTTQFTNKFGDRVDGQPSFRVRIRLPQVEPFRLSRKVARLVNPVSTCSERVLWTIDELESASCTAIGVDSPDNTFVLKQGIVAYGRALEN